MKKLPPAPGNTAAPIESPELTRFKAAYLEALNEYCPDHLKNAQSIEGTVDNVTQDKYERFLGILKQGGMGDASAQDALYLMRHLALTDLKSNSPLGLCSMVMTTPAMVRKYSSNRQPSFVKDITEKVNTSSKTGVRKARAKTANQFLRPSEVEELQERQSIYDAEFDYAGSAYCSAIIRALRLIQRIPPKSDLTRIHAAMLSVLMNRPVGMDAFWMGWLWLSDFNYYLISNWVENLPQPSFIKNASDRDALHAVCDSLLKLGNWNPVFADRCKSLLSVTREATSTGNEVNSRLWEYTPSISMADKVAAEFTYRTSASLGGPKDTLAFSWFKSDTKALSYFDIGTISSVKDNLSDVFEIEKISPVVAFKTLIGETARHTNNRNAINAFTQY